MCLFKMDHCCLGNNVPNTEQRLCLGPATGELKPRVKFHVGFLHAASLFTLAHIFFGIINIHLHEQHFGY